MKKQLLLFTAARLSTSITSPAASGEHLHKKREFKTRSFIYSRMGFEKEGGILFFNMSKK